MNISVITNLVTAKFRSFGGSQGSTTNPIAAALCENPPMFAAGVDIKDVVRFVAEQLESPCPVLDFPMLDGPNITTELAQQIYEKYNTLWSGQSFERVKARGGFSWAEVPVIYDICKRRCKRRRKRRRKG